MSELRVRVTGDAAGFNATLKQAQTSAAAFNQSLVADSKRAAMQSRAQITGGRQLAEAGGRFGRLANVGASAGGIPGVGEASQDLTTAAGGYFGLKMASESLGVSMLKAAGIIAAVVFAWVKLKELGKEAYITLQEALDNLLRTTIGVTTREAAKRKALMDALNKNRDFISDSEYRRLKGGVLTNDRATQLEVARRFNNNPKLIKELGKELLRAQVEAMPEGLRKNIASENLKFANDREKLFESIGTSPTDAAKRIASQIVVQMERERQNKIAELMQKQLEEQRKISSNTKQTGFNYRSPF